MESYYVPALEALIEHFARLPGIGRKSARRMAFFMLAQPIDKVKAFADAMLHAKNTVKCCKICQNLTDEELCNVCKSVKRTPTVICVVESPRDVISMEGTGEFTGLYHVLHGAIDPMNGVEPEDLTVKELLARMTDNVHEVIMATNPTVEGEATAIYLAKLIRPMGIKVTKIANGVPLGADLEYADQMTLTRALEGRIEMK